MTGNTDTLEKVVTWLSRMTARRHVPITCDTEIFHDLGIYGDDVLELVLWLHKEFGVETTNFNLARHVPGENAFLVNWRWLGTLLGIEESQYKSLKVRDILAAIEAQRWPDEI